MTLFTIFWRRFQVFDLELQLYHAQCQRCRAEAECKAIEFDLSVLHEAERMPQCALQALYWRNVAADVTERLRVMRLLLDNARLQRGLSA